MSEQLQGRALDRAVAHVLIGPSADALVAAGDTVDRWEPAYSTDPATQTEMLEWLRGRDGYEWMSIDIDDQKGRFYAYWFGKGDNHESGFGDSINEALARLVLAVAGRDAK